jgi:hypothetical protein
LVDLRRQMKVFRKTSTIALMLLILTSHFNVVITPRLHGAGEADALTALKFIEGELEKGKIPSSSITEACFTIPEGFPVELAQRLWFFIAQLVSIGSSEEEMQRTIKSANDTLKLPTRIDYGLKDYTIIPEYEKICVRRSNDGGVSVEIPYRVVDTNGNVKDASSIRYESNGTNIFHILHRYPKKRTYLVRCIDPDSYAFTFIDLETGKIFNKTARMKIGLFSNLSQGYFVENFLITVPGHFEETREAVESQVSEFRVLLPAYDPIIVDTSISSTKVGIGDTITITAQIRNPQETMGNYMIMLGARLSDNDAFEAWAPPPSSIYSTASLYLRAKKPGVYTITIYFAVVEPSSLDVVFCNGEKTVTYTVEVLPEPPRLEIKLSSQALGKFANLTITLLNKGGQKARNTKLFITGDVDREELDIGTIVGLWSKNVVKKLLSPIAKVNVTVVYYDEEGKRYANTALTTISTTNFVAPEEWRTYVVEVEGYNETKRVFILGYQGATHLKLYFMTTGMMPEYLQDFYGVKLIPISPDGFTLTIENASDISKMAKTLNVRYALIDVKPGFLCERILREDEFKKLLDIPEDDRLEPSKIPSNYEVKLLKEEALNQSELITVSDEFYEWLKYNGWEDHDYKYEDTGETKWDLDKAATRVSHGKEIELVYHPLAYGGGDLIQGVLIRNYAASDVEYELEVFAGPMRAPPEEHAITASAFGSTPLHLVQLEDDVGYPVFINLKHGNRVVATLQVSFRSSKLPEFWRGFWDGFVSKGWGIIVTCGIMVIVGYVLPPKWATAASLAILVTGIAMNIAEICVDVRSALAAMDSLNELADVCEGRVKEFNEISMAQHANELSELSQIFRLEAKDINDNLLSNIISNLALDVSWDEIRIAFGLKEPPSTRDRDYRIGYATGRVVGAIASCAAYVTTFYAVVDRIKAERIGGKPLSIKDVFRIAGRGIWNWITPAIFDALMLKLKPSFNKVVDLLLGNKYSKRFGDVVGNLIEGIKDPSRVEDALETASELSKQVLESVPSESSSSILDAISAIIEHYSLEELKDKGGTIVRSIVSIWIKDGDDAIRSLNSWLSMNTGEPGKVSALEKTLLAIDGNAVKGVGLRVGDIADSYLNVKGKYGESIAETFLNALLKNPDKLEEILSKVSSLDFEEELHEVTLRKGRWSFLRLGSNKVKPGTYVVRVYWKYDEKSGMMEFPVVVKDTESDGINIPEGQAEQALSRIGKDEEKVFIVKVELFDYRIFFPTEFLVSKVKVGLDLFDNEIETSGIRYRFKPSTDVYEGKIRVNAEFEGKNIEGKNLVLSFYQDGKVGVKSGKYPWQVVGVEVDAELKLMIIKYEERGERTAEYSFNFKTLDEQIGKISCEILLEEGQEKVGLKERLFRILGYGALEDLKSRVGEGVDEDRKVFLFIHFDNDEVAYCGSKELKVWVPSKAKRITSIEIVAYKEFDALGQAAARFIEDSDNVSLEGDLGEEYARAFLKVEIRKKASKLLKIPEEELRVEIRVGKKEGPDIYIYRGEMLVLIGDVKSSKHPDEFPQDLWRRADDESFKKYFTEEKWKEQFKNVQYGIRIAVLIKPDALPEALAKRDFKDAFEAAICDEPYPNPNYQPS